MSENKRYYWLKLKKDFFNTKMIKILRTFENGNEMILAFLKIELHSLENDGYIYFENMLPTFEQELAVAIDEDISIVKEMLDVLLRFGAIEKKDDNTYFITMIEDCVGSETRAAERMRKKRSEQCSPENEQSSPYSENCSPEIEKEIEKRESKRKEEKNTSAFSFQKKSGSVNVQNVNFQKNSAEVQHNSAAIKNPPRNYEMEEFLKRNNQSFSDYMPKTDKL